LLFAPFIPDRQFEFNSKLFAYNRRAVAQGACRGVEIPGFSFTDRLKDLMPTFLGRQFERT
jgi:hypothetical protein